MPARTGNTTYVPGVGATTVKGKKKTFQGSGPAPAGASKEPEATYLTAPTVAVSGGTVKTSGYRSQRAARKAVRAQKRRAKRVARIVKETSPEPRKLSKELKYTPPKSLTPIQKVEQRDTKAFNAEGGKQIPVPFVSSKVASLPTGRNKSPQKLPPAKAAKRIKTEFRQAKKAVAGSGGHLTGDLGPEQRKFVRGVAKLTKLKPRTIAAQARAEEGNAAQTEAEGTHNFLNMGPGLSYPSLKAGVKATAANYNDTSSPNYAGVRATRGQSAQLQAEAIAASPWGTTDLILKTLPTVGFKGKPNPKAERKLARVKTEAKAKGVKLPKAPDVSRGGGRTIKVRADAQGAVKWAEAQVSTQEGSGKQLNWAGKFGLGSTEPWCANFVSNDLLRRGINSLPSNPNYVPSFESEWAKYAVSGGLAKAKPGDLLTFSGSHIGIYVGNGEMVSGNSSDAVSRTSAGSPSMVIRPPYKGGFIAVKESTPLPGTSSATGSPSSSAAPVGSTSTSGQRAKAMPKAKLSQAQRVKQTKRKLKDLGVGASTTATSQSSDSTLAALEKKYLGAAA